MLLRFSVENFLSIREPQALSLAAARSCGERSGENAFPAFGGRVSLLKCAVMYGANASGKTNFMKAFAFFLDFALHSADAAFVGEPVPVMPFLFDESSRGRPSVFEAELVDGAFLYRYGFAVSRERVEREWLFRRSSETGFESLLFARERRRGLFRIGKSFRGADRAVREKTRGNALFLTTCAQFAVPEAGRVLGALGNDFFLLTGEGLSPGISRTVEWLDRGDGPRRERIARFLRQTDPCLDELFVRDAEPGRPEGRGARPPAGKRLFFRTRFQKEELPLEAFCSLGTWKAAALAGPVFDALDRGATLFADELDARLHPILTQSVIRLFNSASDNPRNAQLVFNTHDTGLLNCRVGGGRAGRKEALLRRDQIYFVERDAGLASRLYSLIEFKNGGGARVRSDASFEKEYLAGAYGAIPFPEPLMQGAGNE